MERDDLRVARRKLRPGDTLPVTDADLASLGYVKLDHLDMVTLRDALVVADGAVRDAKLSTVEARALDEVWQVARQVLAAIDQENTYGT